MGSEAEVCSYLQPYVTDRLTQVARQVHHGKQAIWRQIPPSELVQEAAIVAVSGAWLQLCSNEQVLIHHNVFSGAGLLCFHVAYVFQMQAMAHSAGGSI